MPNLLFLGSGDSQGVPRWWCGCEVCEEAREYGENARARPSIVIENEYERVLVDAGPETRTQCNRFGLNGFDAVLITHAHADHIQGLSDVADWARFTTEGCPIYMPREIIPDIGKRFHYLLHEPYTSLIPIHALEATQRSFAGYRVRQYKVPHGHNGYSFAFRFEQNGAAWGYMPDCLMLDHLEPWYGLDLLVLGVAYLHEGQPLNQRSIYDQREALELIAKLKPRRTLFTHMSHGIDRRQPAPFGVAYAFDGLKVELPVGVRQLSAAD
jgi:phosphoribosyl 1,2-cyclic phosphate phosphodiesterase